MCEYSRSRSFHDDLILQDQALGERSQDQWSSGPDLCLVLEPFFAIHFSLLGPELLVCCLALRGSTGVFFFFCSGVSMLFGVQGSPSSDSLLNLRVLVFDSSWWLS